MTRGSSSIYLFRGSIPRESTISRKRPVCPVILIDEVGQASTEKVRIIATWMDVKSRFSIKDVFNSFPDKKKNVEVKYNNTTLDERIRIYDHLLALDFDVYDSFDTNVPPSIQTIVRSQYHCSINYNELRYLYQLWDVICRATSDHPGRVDIVIDNPPFEIHAHLLSLHDMLRKNGVNIQWFIVVPSRHEVELQIHDFIAGLDYDIVMNQRNYMDESDTIGRTRSHHLASISSDFCARRKVEKGV